MQVPSVCYCLWKYSSRCTDKYCTGVFSDITRLCFMFCNINAFFHSKHSRTPVQFIVHKKHGNTIFVVTYTTKERNFNIFPITNNVTFTRMKKIKYKYECLDLFYVPLVTRTRKTRRNRYCSRFEIPQNKNKKKLDFINLSFTRFLENVLTPE